MNFCSVWRNVCVSIWIRDFTLHYLSLSVPFSLNPYLFFPCHSLCHSLYSNSHSLSLSHALSLFLTLFRFSYFSFFPLLFSFLFLTLFLISFSHSLSHSLSNSLSHSLSRTHTFFLSLPPSHFLPQFSTLKITLLFLNSVFLRFFFISFWEAPFFFTIKNECDDKDHDR